MMNAKLKQRLGRLERIIQLEHVPEHIPLLRLALAQLSDEDLAILKVIFYRGAPISAQTEEEQSTLERLSVAARMAEQKMAAGPSSEAGFA